MINASTSLAFAAYHFKQLKPGRVCSDCVGDCVSINGHHEISGGGWSLERGLPTLVIALVDDMTEWNACLLYRAHVARRVHQDTGITRQTAQGPRKRLLKRDALAGICNGFAINKRLITQQQHCI